MKDKEKKNGFHLKNLFSDRYTNFQKMWIGILLILIVSSLVLTIAQIGKLVFRSDSPVAETKAKASASPSTETDTVVLKETQDAGRDYVNNTLFLGDSNTVRFMNEEDEDGNTYTTKDNTIAVVGMGVDAIDSLKCMEFSTGTYTMVDSVKILQPQRIIITFGTNNLSGSDSESSRKTFIESYTKQLKKIKEAYPSVDLIVNSIPPIAENTVYRNLSAEEIVHWNQAIEEMCRQNKWHYLNSSEVLADSSTGYALSDMMDPTDGLHLGDKGLKTLFEYIRTHASDTKDTRPKPLNDIPEIIGCKTDMITTNPLNGSTFNGTEGGTRKNVGNQQTSRQEQTVPQTGQSQTQTNQNQQYQSTNTQQKTTEAQPQNPQQPSNNNNTPEQPVTPSEPKQDPEQPQPEDNAAQGE